MSRESNGPEVSLADVWILAALLFMAPSIQTQTLSV